MLILFIMIKLNFQAFNVDTYFPNEFMYDNNIPVTTSISFSAIKSDDRRRPGPREI